MNDTHETSKENEELLQDAGEKSVATNKPTEEHTHDVIEAKKLNPLFSDEAEDDDYDYEDLGDEESRAVWYFAAFFIIIIVTGVIVLAATVAQDSEKIQIRIHIKGKSVHGYPTRTFDAECRDFTRTHALVCINPNTRQTFDASGFYTIICTRKNDCLFQHPHKLANVSVKLIQIQNGIAHQLSRAMVCNVSSSVDGKVFDTQFFQSCWSNHNIFGVS